MSKIIIVLALVIAFGGFLIWKNVAKAQDEYHGEDLHEAVMWDDLKAVKRLVESGAPIDVPGFGGATPALVAAQVWAWDICYYLLQQGADPHITSEFGMTIPQALQQSRPAPGTMHHDYMLKVKALYENPQ